MKTAKKNILRTAWVGLLLSAGAAMAYPPAPPHTLYGMIRGEDGEPVNDSSYIVFETSEGQTFSGAVSENLEPGINYEMIVPMDVDPSNPYHENALAPEVPFRIYVVIGASTHVPLQMQGDYLLLGDEGRKTRLDLTLGVDSDGDGLPDAWEQFLIDILGGGLTLSDIEPDGDDDGDGMTNFEEYIAGTYAFDHSDLFELHLKERTTNATVFQFLAIGGRTYTIEETDDLQEWNIAEFSVPSIRTNQVIAYPASRVGTVEIEVNSTNPAVFYRGVVQ
ncbi:hypothetical protein [Pontiella agarivorans]|uniref:Uncharacterized protein n=1 Tax=Pontiella agarivorans TaxID=3038953 RepID=A0ABU5N0D2_9BACT|nr:hypothetical protein [Pontiella agarivorans]MDZ8119882.1 hypothetical protein [Pontiella agarivorans]